MLLGQHSGSDDIVDVTSVAGRSAPELEPLMGACCACSRCFLCASRQAAALCSLTKAASLLGICKRSKLSSCHTCELRRLAPNRLRWCAVRFFLCAQRHTWKHKALQTDFVLCFAGFFATEVALRTKISGAPEEVAGTSHDAYLACLP